MVNNLPVKYKKSFRIRLKDVFLICLIMILIVSSIIIYFIDNRTLEKSLKHINKDPLTFNYESGFYNNDLKIKISKHMELPTNVDIYYTLNGNDPKETDELYKDEIKLEVGEETKVIPLKARIYWNGQASDVYEKTYVLDKNIYNRFNMPVISLTSDSYNLYDYNYGIFAKGALYDENREKDLSLRDYEVEANYTIRTEEWLRDCHVTMIEESGDVILNNNYKFGVSGKGTAGEEVKSLKIHAIDPNRISFVFDKVEADNSMVDEYNNIRLRAGGNDRQYSNIRSSVFSRIAAISNFDSCADTQRAVVYLNGNYYGIFDIGQTFSDSYLAKHFNIKNKENIIKLKGDLDNSLREIDVYKYFENDLNNKEMRKTLEDHVDIDNYLTYMAIEQIANNVDWPHNNAEIWYYDTSKGEETSKYADGRIRMLLYDMDMTFYTEEDFPWVDGFMNKFIEQVQEETSFSHVMKSKYYRDKFITIVCDLINTSFSKETLNKIIDEEYEKIRYESLLHLEGEGRKMFLDSIGIMKKGAQARCDTIISNIEEVYELHRKYTLNIKSNDGIKIYWNNMEIFENEEYQNKYYKGVNINLSYEEYPGYDFKYWIVNGETITDNELKITEDLVKGNLVNVEAVAEKNNKETLIISEISAKGDNDWIKIENAGKNNVNLADYYLSDDMKNIEKYNLPDIELKPNESIIIDGKKNYLAKGEYRGNFNLNETEVIYLANKTRKKIQDVIEIPNMSRYETYGRYDNSNTYRFFRNLDDKRKVSTY